MNHLRSPELILKEIQTWEGIISTLQQKIQTNPDKLHRHHLIKEHQNRLLELHKELHETRKAQSHSPPVQPEKTEKTEQSHSPPVQPEKTEKTEQFHSPPVQPEKTEQSHKRRTEGVQESCEHQNSHHWNKNQLSGNPIRHEQLEILLTILKGVYQENTSILDFGIGSGSVEKKIFKALPSAHIVGLDFSDEMLELARQSLKEQNCVFVKADITKMKVFQIPPAEYSAVISVQTFHQLPHTSKRRLFSLIYQLLNPQGVFLLMDRISIPNQELYHYYQMLWKRQENIYETKIQEGNCFHEYENRLQTNGDLPLSLEQLLNELNNTGFQATCLHLHGNHALLAAHRGDH